MKSTELRIGNWVLCEPNNASIERTIDYEDFRLAHFDSERFEPIPLTEEWLVKFGFEPLQLNTEEGTWIEYKIDIGKNDQIRVLDDFSLCTFAFGDIAHAIGESNASVHQLQNLYFALTNTELELND